MPPLQPNKGKAAPLPQPSTPRLEYNFLFDPTKLVWMHVFQTSNKNTKYFCDMKTWGKFPLLSTVIPLLSY